MDYDQATPVFVGDPYTFELRIVGDHLVQLAGFRDHQHADDALPDLVLNFAPLEAANLGQWLQEFASRAIRDSC
jgi:hypothetical protein